MGKDYHVYILTNRPRGTLYIGMTGDLYARIKTHKEGDIKGFTKRYRLNLLVYYETFSSPTAAIAREKLLKHWYRKWKIDLVEKDNPDWNDLADDW